MPVVNRRSSPDEDPASERSAPAGRLGGLEIAAILLALIPLFLNLDLTSAWKSEGRWLCVTSHMLETGDYIEPQVNGTFYGDKPLLSYWAIALLAVLRGHLDEQIARLPSVLSAAATVLITAWMAWRLGGRRLVIPAVWILATNYSFFFWSRVASSDLLSLMFATGAIAVYLKSTFGFRPWQPLVFFTLLALGGQSKGMPGILVPLGIVMAHGIVMPVIEGLLGGRGWRGSLGGVLPPDRATLRRNAAWTSAGLAIGVVLYALPFVISWAHRGDWELLSLMWKENLVRALDAFDHRGPVLYYVYTLPVMFLPWSLWLPGALGWAGKNFRTNPCLRFALIAFAVIFCAFTASESRRSYYILPILPFAAMLVAGFWDGRSGSAARGNASGRIWHLLAVLPCALFEAVLVLIVLFVLGGGLLPDALRRLSAALPHPFLLATSIAIGFVAIRYLSYRRGLRARFLAIGAAAIVLTFWLATDGEVLRSERYPERPFAAEVRKRLAGDGFLYFRMRHSPLVYYLGEAPIADAPEKIVEFLRGGRGHVFVICKGDDVRTLKDFDPLSSVEVSRAHKKAVGSLTEGNDIYFLFRCELRTRPATVPTESGEVDRATDDRRR